MLKFIMKRIFEAIPTMLVLITISFFLMRFQDTMDEWAAALAEAEGTDDDSAEVKVTELDELDDSKHELSGEEKRYYFR